MVKVSFFSIIIPTFNSAGSISKSIESVLNQSFQDFEIIVVDDGSTDNTVQVIEQFKSNKVRYVSQQNAGPAAARNFGSTLAGGRYFIFLDADDWVSNDYLKGFHAALIAGKRSLGLGFVQYINEAGNLAREIKPWKNDHTFSYGICGSFVISHELFGKLRGYDSQLMFSENSDLFLRIELEKLMSIDELVLVEGAGVFVLEMDRRQRNLKYLTKKYSSLKYFMIKHEVFFGKTPKYYVLYKRIYAKCAMENRDFKEARKSIREIIAKTPFTLKNYAHFVFLCFPRLVNFVLDVNERRARSFRAD